MEKNWPVHAGSRCFSLDTLPLEWKLHEDSDLLFAVVSPTDLCPSPKWIIQETASLKKYLLNK